MARKNHRQKNHQRHIMSRTPLKKTQQNAECDGTGRPHDPSEGFPARVPDQAGVVTHRRVHCEMSPFPWKNTLLVTAAACLGLVSLLVTATLSLRLQERIMLVQGVRDLRRQVSLLGKALREAEAAQRMFVITGDEAHHALFAGVRDAIPRRWRSLEEAAARVPGPPPDFDTLRLTTDEALASLEETATTRRSAGRDAAMERVQSGRSEKQLVAAHLQLEALTEQLEQRTEEETRSLALAESRGRAASVGAGLVALAVGTLGIWQWWWSLRHYRRQLELAAEKRRAEQMARDKGDFLAAMSHEVRTPLNTILGMSDQLATELPAGPPAEKAEAVRTAAHTMLGLVNDLLDLSRLEAGRLELVCSAVPVAAELAWLDRLLGPQAGAAGVTLDLAAAADLPPVLWLDGGRFRQILVNLTANGLKFTPRGGRVQVRLERSESVLGPELVVEVKDTGIGIAPEAHARIFQPYVQGVGRETTGPGHGAGLGLAIVRQLVGLMSGTISLQSRPGEGAVFRVLLPLREPPGTAFATRTPAAPAAAPAAPDARKPPGPRTGRRLRARHAARLRDILDRLYPPAAATHSTDDVKRLAEALATLGETSGCAPLAEEAARLEAASASFALTELSDALASLPHRLSSLHADD
jgi:signal transduction histidine kinase